MTIRSKERGSGESRTVTARLLAYAPAAAWAALLLVIGAAEHVPGPSTSLPLDKVAHFVAYGILGALTALGWRRAGRWPHRVWLLVLVLGLAAADELNQTRVPGRSGDAADWLADIAGVVVAFTVASRSRSSIFREGNE